MPAIAWTQWLLRYSNNNVYACRYEVRKLEKPKFTVLKTLHSRRMYVHDCLQKKVMLTLVSNGDNLPGHLHVHAGCGTRSQLFNCVNTHPIL